MMSLAAADLGRLAAFADMGEAEFLGQPRITTDANAKELVPSELRSHADLSPVPFLHDRHGSRYGAAFSEHGVTVYDLEHGKSVVGSYSNFGAHASTLVVAKGHRRLGLGAEMVYEWRLRNPNAAVGNTRTKKSHALQRSVWERIQRELRGAQALAARALIEGACSKPVDRAGC